MNKLSNYFKCYFYFSVIYIIYIFLISIFYYFDIVPLNIISIINYICTLIIFFHLGHKISKKERIKGYLNGFLISLILITLFSIITLFIDKYTFSTLVYYLTLISSSIVGGIIGVK